jgi:hypothetical protein
MTSKKSKPIMQTLDNLKEKVNLKMREKAILHLKKELAMRHKTFDDYSDEEIEIMLSSEIDKIKGTWKTRSIYGLAALLGISWI